MPEERRAVTRDNRKRHFTASFKGKEIVESYIYIHPDRKRFTVEEAPVNICLPCVYAQVLQIVSLALISTNPLYVYACDLIMSLDDLLVFINSQWGIVLPLVQMFHSVIGSVGPIQGRNCKRVCLFTFSYL